MADSNDNRCWPGYEPVKGKPAHSQGSCRPKAESKTTSSEKNFRAKRRKQLDKWEAEHPGTRKSASQHLAAPGAKNTSSKKKTSSAASKRKTAVAKKTTAKKSTPRKTTARKTTAQTR